MNYLSHAYLHLDNPYFAAGTGLPDWMSVIDRKNRARRQYALPITEHKDPVFAELARGCVQHHADDFWFHQCPRFVSMSTEFAVELRDLLEKGLGHQAGFAGHVIVELLLDSVLCERDPTLLDRYYDNLRSLNVERLEAATNAICRKPVDKIRVLVPRFIEERFLADYGDDEKLHWRLNGVMRRIGLPLLPQVVVDWLGTARVRVREHADELLTPPQRSPERI